MISKLKFALFYLFFLSFSEAQSSLTPDHLLEDPTVHHFKIVPDSDADSTSSPPKITAETRSLTEKVYTHHYCNLVTPPRINEHIAWISQSLTMAKDLSPFVRNDDQQVPVIPLSPEREALHASMFEQIQLYSENYISDESSPDLPVSLPKKT